MAKKSYIKKEQQGRRLSTYNSKDGIVSRLGWGPDKNRIKKDPSFKAVKLHGLEFGAVAACVSVFKSSMHEFLADTADHRVTGRITGMFLKIKNLDTKNNLGARKVSNGILTPAAEAIIRDFSFNKTRKLVQGLRKPIDVDQQTGRILLKGLKAKEDLKIPKGATHVSFTAGWVKIDFNKGTFEVSSSGPVTMDINSKMTDVLVKPEGKPKMKGASFYVLKIGFVQEIGGVQYILSDRSFNVGGVVRLKTFQSGRKVKAV